MVSAVVMPVPPNTGSKIMSEVRLGVWEEINQCPDCPEVRWDKRNKNICSLAFFLGDCDQKGVMPALHQMVPSLGWGRGGIVLWERAGGGSWLKAALR